MIWINNLLVHSNVQTISFIFICSITSQLLYCNVVDISLEVSMMRRNMSSDKFQGLHTANSPNRTSTSIFSRLFDYKDKQTNNYSRGLYRPNEGISYSEISPTLKPSLGQRLYVREARSEVAFINQPGEMNRAGDMKDRSWLNENRSPPREHSLSSPRPRSWSFDRYEFQSRPTENQYEYRHENGEPETQSLKWSSPEPDEQRHRSRSRSRSPLDQYDAPSRSGVKSDIMPTYNLSRYERNSKYSSRFEPAVNQSPGRSASRPGFGIGYPSSSRYSPEHQFEPPSDRPEFYLGPETDRERVSKEGFINKNNDRLRNRGSPGINKKTKKKNPSKFRGQTSNEIRVSIALKNYPDAKLDLSQVEALREALDEELDKFNLVNSPLSFQGFKRKKDGTVMVICCNHRSKQWLANALKKIQPWKDAKLQLLESDSSLKLKQLFASVPGKTNDPVSILERVEKYNPGLSTNMWIVHESTVNTRFLPSVRLVLGVDMKSLKMIIAKNFKLSYGMSRMSFWDPEKTKKRIAERALKKSQAAQGKDGSQPSNEAK